MSTLADSTRVSPILVAVDGQTDFAIAFPLLETDGDPALGGTRWRAGVAQALTSADFSIASTSDTGFVLRLVVAAEADDQYVFWGQQPGSRSREQPLYSQARTAILEDDMAQLYTLVQELRRDTRRSLKSSLLTNLYDGSGGRLTNLGDGSAATDAVTVEQLQAAIGGAVPVLLGDFPAYETRAAAMAANVPTPQSALLLKGYAAAGDLGHGLYKRVDADPSPALGFQSAGGQWWQLVEPEVRPQQAGAKGDGQADDTAALQAVANAVLSTGGTLHLPGRFRVTQTVTFDFAAHQDALDGKLIRLRGGAQGGTLILNAANAAAFKFLGSTVNGEWATFLNIEDLAFARASDAVGANDIGLDLEAQIWGSMNRVYFYGLTLGLSASDVLGFDFIACRFRFNSYGAKFVGEVQENGSTPNAVNFYDCTFYGQANYGAYFLGGCNVNFFGGSIENTTGGSDAQRFGVKLDRMGDFGYAAANFFGTFFEANGNVADIWIASGDVSCAYTAIGCTFNRESATAYSTYNILLATNSNGAARQKLTVIGCGFADLGDYAPDASRPYIGITGTTPVRFSELGNEYQTLVSAPTKESNRTLGWARLNGVTGDLFRGDNVSSTTRLSTGVYKVNLVDGPVGGAGPATLATMDIPGCAYLSASDAASVTITCLSLAGAATDCGELSVLLY